MRFSPSGHPDEPLHIDPRNVAVGAAVSSLLVALLGFGTMAVFQARTPREDGVNIGGALLATLGCLLGVGVGAAFTARRARRRASRPLPEGICAGLLGYLLAVLGVGWLLVVVHDIPPLELLNLLPLLVPGIAAASAGAAIGGRRGRLASRPPGRP